MNENEDRQRATGGQGDGDEAMDSRHHDSSVSMPPPASRRPFTPDGNERFCVRCCRLVIRRGHRSRCSARKGTP